MAITYVYPGTGTGTDSHPYPTRVEHQLSEPFTLSDHTNAALGPGAYSDNMWYQLESLKDPVIQMQLLQRWRAGSIWRQYSPTQVAMRTPTGAISETMTWKGIFDMEPTPEPVGLRQIWYPNNYTDTWSKQINLLPYADKVALHEYDDRVQAYLFNGRAGLKNIAATLLGQSATVFQDILIRNAYLDHPYPRFTGAATDFSGIDDTATYWFDPTIAGDIWMDLAYQGHPMAQNPNGNGAGGTMICLTTPSVINNIQQQVGNEWYTLYMQANPGALLQYEVGMYKNVRYAAHPLNVLWNCGDIITRAALDNAYGPGDGAGGAGLVDGVYTVGQSTTTGVVQWIENTVDVAFPVGAFVVGDIVTIHQTVTADFGVTDGVDYREGTARRRRIVAIGDGVTGPAGALTFDRPLYHEFPAGSFITRAQDIHPSVFMAGPGGCVTGVGQPIEAYPMDPIDDARAIWRFIWKGLFKTQLFMPEVYEVFFSGGTRPTRGIAQGL
jgi:hypothetical protein